MSLVLVKSGQVFSLHLEKREGERKRVRSKTEKSEKEMGKEERGPIQTSEQSNGKLS